MMLWCYKNKYLIMAEVGKGIITKHNTADCFQCPEKHCELPLIFRELDPESLKDYFEWLLASPADKILYRNRINIITRKLLDAQAHKKAQILYSLPPILIKEYWTTYYLHKQDGASFDPTAKMKDLVYKVREQYEGWNPSLPYWDNPALRLKND